MNAREALVVATVASACGGQIDRPTPWQPIRQSSGAALDGMQGGSDGTDAADADSSPDRTAAQGNADGADPIDFAPARELE